MKDPARGSYFIESLTNDIVEKTWTLFLEIEKAGGIFQQIKEGNIQQQLQEIKEK